MRNISPLGLTLLIAATFGCDLPARVPNDETPVVRDHRDDKAPVVRDHRDDKTPEGVVRDHRN
jgi:hypothetical protein